MSQDLPRFHGARLGDGNPRVAIHADRKGFESKAEFQKVYVGFCVSQWVRSENLIFINTELDRAHQ